MKIKIKKLPGVSPLEVKKLLNVIDNKSYWPKKMTNLINFLNEIIPLKTKAEIVETGLTIDENGKLWSHEQMMDNYRKTKKNKFSFEAPEELIDKLDRIHSDINDLKKSLKKTRNKEKKEGFINTIGALWDEIHGINTEIEKMEKEAEEKYNAEVDQESLNTQQLREIMMFYEGVKIRFETKAGRYTFPVPIDIPYYETICNIIGLPVNNNKTAEKPVIKRMFTLSAGVLPAIKKAIKFVSKDNLRPAMRGVNIEISDGKMIIVATDAHRLFKSCEFEITGAEGSYNYLLPADELKSLPKSVDESFMLYELGDNKLHFLGFNINLLDAPFPNWKVVMPNHKSEIVFDRKEMINKIKEVLVYSNKTTQQINFNFNGEIKLSAQDVDFSYEANARLTYHSSTINDLEIGFNGIFMIEGLKIFNTEKITLKAESPTRAGIITDGNDTVLIMPIMLNN